MSYRKFKGPTKSPPEAGVLVASLAFTLIASAGFEFAAPLIRVNPRPTWPFRIVPLNVHSLGQGRIPIKLFKVKIS
jgi:hypothetical protein